MARLHGGESLRRAFELTGECMPVKKFSGGFCAHVSLLRLPKDFHRTPAAATLLRELNASGGAAMSRGVRWHLHGQAIGVFSPECRCCLRIPIRSGDPASAVAA